MGTGCIKAGWAGEGRARYVLPTCAGAVRRRPQLYLSEECYALQEYICSRPSQGGLWANLEMLRDIIDMSFGRKYLGTDPKELSGVALTEPLLTPAPLRHHISEILFEDLGVERLSIVAAQAVVPYAFWGMGWGSHDMCAPPRAKRMAITCYSGPDLDPQEPSGPVGGPLKGKGAPCADPCFSPRLAATTPSAEGVDLSMTGHVSPGRNPFGLIVDVGFSASHAVPVVNYTTLEASALRSEIGGTHANAYLKNLLLTRGLSLEKNELFAQKASQLPWPRQIWPKRALPAGPPVLRTVEPLSIRGPYCGNACMQLKEETCFIARDPMGVLKRLSTLPGGRRAAHLGGPLLVERETPDYSLSKAQLATYFHTHSPAPIPDLSSLKDSGDSHARTGSTNDNQHIGGSGETATKCSTPSATSRDPHPPSSAEVSWVAPAAPTRPTVKLTTERLIVPEILWTLALMNDSTFVHAQSILRVSLSAELQEKCWACILLYPFVNAVYAGSGSSDGGSTECGVAELIYRAICKAPIEAQPFLASQIFLVGGSTKFWGFRERLCNDLRAMLPEHWPIHIYQHEDPQHSAWLGASNWAHDDGVYLQFSVSRQQFLETGLM
ncbi:actin-like family protein [Cyclospora cayetanensis]|uniref:Actin-like family protein n=1 Tax=Cyclospora cayetanensis TaxID=88456 RepID=A0A1D3D9T1_9EIME|nr:actin-like family protein [Cyclospora cayetanensis]